MKVEIFEMCDGFEVTLYNTEGEVVGHYPFPQEDSTQGLVEVFKELGIEASHQEVY